MKSFDLQPTLRGKLLSLRPLRREDFEFLYAVSSDPLIWEMHPERLRYRRDVFRRYFDAGIGSGGAFAAVNAESNEIIGSSRFTAHDPAKSQIEVGFTFLARKCWGKGFNTEMKKLMLDHAFQFVDRIVFYIGEENLRSRRAIEKIGARLLQKIPRQPKEGADYVAIVYGLEKSDWLSNRNH